MTSMSGSTLLRNGSSDKRRQPMSEKTWKRNTSGMIAHAHLRKEEKRKRVDEVVTRLLREQQTINFHTVAKAAGVSKAYLYSQSDLRERIETLRQQEME